MSVAKLAYSSLVRLARLKEEADMSLIAQELHEVWNALRANNRNRDDALSEVRIRKLRGIWDLRVPFEYPVSVLAGPNGCGKSTVLFTCACAYLVPGRGPREFAPSRLFPNFTSKQQDALSDATQRSELEFHYLHRGDRLSMIWRRRKSWNRSFQGRTGGSQPERDVFLRTLANLTNPSEVRSVLQLGRRAVQSEPLSPELLLFAHRILPGGTATSRSSAPAPPAIFSSPRSRRVKT